MIRSCRKEERSTGTDNSMSGNKSGKRPLKDTRGSIYRGVSKNGPKW